MRKNKDNIKNSRQFKKIAAKPVFVKIPLNFCVDFNFTPSEALVYSVIERYTDLKNEMGFKGYLGGVVGLQAYTNLSRRTIDGILKRLCARGIVYEDHSANASRTVYKCVDFKTLLKRRKAEEMEMRIFGKLITKDNTEYY